MSARAVFLRQFFYLPVLLAVLVMDRLRKCLRRAHYFAGNQAIVIPHSRISVPRPERCIQSASPSSGRPRLKSHLCNPQPPRPHVRDRFFARSRAHEPGFLRQYIFSRPQVIGIHTECRVLFLLFGFFLNAGDALSVAYPGKAVPLGGPCGKSWSRHGQGRDRGGDLYNSFGAMHAPHGVLGHRSGAFRRFGNYVTPLQMVPLTWPSPG